MLLRKNRNFRENHWEKEFLCIKIILSAFLLTYGMMMKDIKDAGQWTVRGEAKRALFGAR